MEDGAPLRSDNSHVHVHDPGSDLESRTELGPGTIHVTKAFTVSEGGRDLYALDRLDSPDRLVTSPKPARV